MKSILYSADWCGYCVTAKHWFATHQIKFTEKNVDDPGVRDEMNQKTNGNQTIPTLILNNEYYVNPSVRTLQTLFLED